MTHPTRLGRAVLAGFVTVCALFALTGCDPWNPSSWTLRDVQVVRDGVAKWRAENDVPSTMTCREALDAFWPASSHDYAWTIILRESGGRAGAQNSMSSAAGCFQIVRGTYEANAAQFCDWSERYNASCNVRTALNIWRGSGWSPWVTAY